MKPDEPELPYLNPKTRATLCAEIVEYQNHSNASDESVIRQLLEKGYPYSWAALLVYNADALAA